MPAYHQNLFRMLAPANFSDHVGRLYRSIGKSILHIEAHARCHAPVQTAFQLSLVPVVSISAEHQGQLERFLDRGMTPRPRVTAKRTLLNGPVEPDPAVVAL